MSCRICLFFESRNGYKAMFHVTQLLETVIKLRIKCSLTFQSVWKSGTEVCAALYESTSDRELGRNCSEIRHFTRPWGTYK
jgi:hypothetical protein